MGKLISKALRELISSLTNILQIRNKILSKSFTLSAISLFFFVSFLILNPPAAFSERCAIRVVDISSIQDEKCSPLVGHCEAHGNCKSRGYDYSFNCFGQFASVAFRNWGCRSWDSPHHVAKIKQYYSCDHPYCQGKTGSIEDKDHDCELTTAVMIP